MQPFHLRRSEPVIVIDGVDHNSKDVVAHELRRRGFIVQEVLSREQKDNDGVPREIHSFAVTICRKLGVKLAVQLEFDVLPLWKYSKSQQLILADLAIDILHRCPLLVNPEIHHKGVSHLDIWIAHDQSFLSSLMKEDHLSPSETISDAQIYFGPQFSIGVVMESFFHKSLLPPAVLGAIPFFLPYQEQLHWRMISWFFSGLWGTLFLKLWNRRFSKLSEQWGLADHSDEIEYLSVIHSWSSILYWIITVLIVFMVLPIGMISLYSSVYSYFVDDRFYRSTILYVSCCLLISNTLVPSIINILSYFEYHSLSKKNRLHSHVISIDFTLQFVTQFSAILYALLYEGCFQRVRAMVIALLIISHVLQAIQNRLSAAPTRFFDFLYQYNVNFFLFLFYISFSLIDCCGRISNCLNEPPTDWTALLRDELSRAPAIQPEAALDHVMLSRALQFGQIAMLSVVVPELAGLSLLLEMLISPTTSWISSPSESVSYWQEQLRQPRRRFTGYRCQYDTIPIQMNAWKKCFRFLSVMALFMSVFCAVYRFPDNLSSAATPSTLHQLLHSFIPSYNELDAIHDLPVFQFKFLIFVVLEHVLGLSAFLVHHYVPDHIGHPRKRDIPLTGYEKLFASLVRHQRKKEIEDNSLSSMTKKSCLEQLDPLDVPSLVWLLLLLPLLLQHFSIPWWMYLPVALLYSSYLQARKRRRDRKEAIDIVTDPAVLRLVIKEMPAWVSDSQYQRVEWFNTLLQKLWPQLSFAIDEMSKEKLQPLLDKQCPSMLSHLLIQQFSLGNISPKITSIRLHNSFEASVLRLDVELRWAGDPCIRISVGTRPLPTPLEISELRFSAIARVELLELNPQLPCFKALSVTFMKKPSLDFSLKVAALDIMNLGPAEYNITSLVRSILHKTLSESALYPKKIIVPMTGKSTEQDGGSNTDAQFNNYSNPEGVLYLTVSRGKDLKRANMFGSDPYCLISTVADQIFRTAIKYYNLNPVWEETFEIFIYDKSTQSVMIEVNDADMVNLETFLGRTQVEVSSVIQEQLLLSSPHTDVEQTLPLNDIAPQQGSITLRMHYVPILTNNEYNAATFTANAMHEEEREMSMVEDILYDLEEEDLRNDVLLNDRDNLSDEDSRYSDENDREESSTSGVWAWKGTGSGSGLTDDDEELQEHLTETQRMSLRQANHSTTSLSTATATHSRTKLTKLRSKRSIRDVQSASSLVVSTPSSIASASMAKSSWLTTFEGPSRPLKTTCVAVLTVSSLRLRNLKLQSGFFSGVPRCYFNCSIRGSAFNLSRRTQSQKPSAELLTFRESFSFTSHAPLQEHLVIHLLTDISNASSSIHGKNDDKHSGIAGNSAKLKGRKTGGEGSASKPLGWLELSLREVADLFNNASSSFTNSIDGNHRQRDGIEQEFMLEGDVSECFLALKIKWNLAGSLPTNSASFSRPPLQHQASVKFSTPSSTHAVTYT